MAFLEILCKKKTNYKNKHARTQRFDNICAKPTSNRASDKPFVLCEAAVNLAVSRLFCHFIDAQVNKLQTKFPKLKSNLVG